MKFLIIAIYLVVSTLSFAGSNYSQDRLAEFKNLNDKVESLEKALRLQSLVNTAVDNQNYDLACKAQSELQDLVEKAQIRDIITQIKDYKSAYCTMKKYSSL
jgi:hypothetical protein